jgi:nicotinamide-nucleotide amidase
VTGTFVALSSDETTAFLDAHPAHAAALVIARLIERGQTLACAESLTGGLLADSLVSVPGASAAFRGSAVTYATDAKSSVLHVDSELLARCGAVDPEVARQMSTGARVLYGADRAIATTGVAGPTEQDGKPVGLAYVGVAGPDDVSAQVYELRLEPDIIVRLMSGGKYESNREGIRRAVTQVALGLLLQDIERHPLTDHAL